MTLLIYETNRSNRVRIHVNTLNYGKMLFEVESSRKLSILKLYELDEIHGQFSSLLASTTQNIHGNVDK